MSVTAKIKRDKTIKSFNLTRSTSTKLELLAHNAGITENEMLEA